MLLDPIRTGDRRAFAAAIVGFTVATLYQYHGPGVGVAAVLYLAIPLAAGWAILRAPPHRLGISLGDWRFGLPVSLAACVAVVPILWLSSRNLRGLYPYVPPHLFLVYYFSLEFLWRGYFQIGLGDRIGALDALMIQVGAACLVHWGKPEMETLASLVSGTLFGLLAWRTRSILWPTLIHWWIGVFNQYLCAA